ncbi:MAG: hypothetical protein M1817_000671 [Caeruleum heppii]|nr:MAG: hypothetical protein M1817_000671 [Caeruleum heppii]
MDPQQSKKLRLEQELFRKRRISFCNKANELHTKYHADVYAVIYRKGRYYTYKSRTDSAWPPSDEQLNKYYPVPDRRTPDNIHTRRLTLITVSRPPELPKSPVATRTPQEG